MRTRILPAAFLGMAAFTSAFLYFYWASPEINRPLGLDQFEESLVRARVVTTAQRLLENPGGLDVRLQQELDKGSLRRMQELFGFKAATIWAEREVPIMRWTYRVFKPKALTRWSFLRAGEPDLVAQVGSLGQILSLKIPPRREPSPITYTPEEARLKAEDALRLVGVDVGALTLTSTSAGEEEGRQKFEFFWKQPVKGLPGLLYRYSVQLQSGYLTSFQQELLFAEEEQPHPWRDLVFQLLFGATWFFLVLVFIFLFFQKLRRDEVDFPHAQKVGIVMGAVTFARFITNPSGGMAQTLLGAALVSILSALFFAVLWSVAESFLRQSMGEKLRFVDLLFQGRPFVREMGRDLLWAVGWSALLLLVPAALLLAASAGPDLDLSLLPLNLTLSNLRVPGGLVGNALIGPLFLALLVGTVFAGVVYPILRLRFSAWVAGGLFSLLFALGLGWLLQEAIAGPVGVAFAVALVAGGMLFAVMEKSGLLASLVFLYVPVAALNAALLMTGRHSPFQTQAWISLGILLAEVGLAAWVAIRGRPMATVGGYEPAYLVRMRERERFTRELEIAKGVQERFLPKATPVVPGFSLATRCVPAMEVGGDYYDFLPLPGGKWVMLLGDVSGKGVKAAFYMTLTKGILHAIAGSEGDHYQILLRLNRVFGALSEPGIFLTLCAVVLEPQARSVQLLSAGHNPPLLLRRGSARTLEPKGLVLGVMGDEVFNKSLKDVRMALEPGDTLVLYTDGVTEAMDQDHQEYGMDRLTAAIEGAAGKDAHGILESIVEDVVRFQQGGPQADDMTLLVLQAHES